MEVLLLWIDDLDDAAVALWTLLPRAFGFLFAVGAFLATGVACLRLPALALPSLALLLVSTMLYRARPPAQGGPVPSA